MSTAGFRVAIFVLTGVGALALGFVLVESQAASSAKPLVVKLKQKHASKISGTATISPARRGIRVVLRLSGPIERNSPAHIHTGPCRIEPTFANPRINSGLTSVVRGRSVTTVDLMTMAKLRARSFSINVHDPGSYAVVACGDIPRTE